MNGTRCVLLAGLAAVVAAMVLGSPSSFAEKPAWWDRKPPVVITYVIVEPCVLTNEAGVPIETVGLRKEKVIRWINRTEDPVTIGFDPPIVSRDHIYLRSGDSYVTTITKLPPEIGEVKITIVCLDPEAGPMALVPPEPIECPPDSTIKCP